MAVKRKFELFQPVNQSKTLWDKRLKPKGLLGGHLNIRSIVSKTEQLQGLLIDSNLGFLFISESWLTESSPRTVFAIPGYQVFRKDRKLVEEEELFYMFEITLNV